jgi:hypothetical protein
MTDHISISSEQTADRLAARWVRDDQRDGR